MHEENVLAVLPPCRCRLCRGDAAAGDAGDGSAHTGERRRERWEQMLGKDTALRKKRQVIQKKAGNRSE